MESLSEFGRRVHFWLHRSEANRELEEEMQFHLRMKTQKLQESGLSEREAPFAAQRQFGNPLLLKELSTQAWGWHWLETILQDVRFAGRAMKQNKAFTAVAVLTLALGIGANSVVFSFVDGVSTRPLPVRDPGGLVRLFETNERGEQGGISYPDLRDFNAQAKDSIELMGVEQRGALMKSGDRTVLLMKGVVSGNYFTLLGVNAQLGRVFTQTDRAEAPVAVMSYNLWQRSFHGDASIVGRPLRFGGEVYTVIGVAPKGFRGTELWIDTDLWVPVSSFDIYSPGEHEDRRVNGLDVFGRLRPGVSLQQARAAVELTARRLEKDYPATNAKRGVALQMNSAYQVRQWHYLPVILLALVSLVLLIACANVANLLLARSEARGREIGVRLSLGCSRARLVRQFFTESAVLAAMGAAAAVALTAWVVRYLPRVMQGLDPDIKNEFPLDGRVLVYTFIAAIATVFLFGLAPAYHSTRTNLAQASRSGGSRSRRGWRSFPNALVSAQIALTLVVLTVAGLLGRTVVRMMQADLGFARKNVLILDVVSAYDGAKRDEVNAMLLDRLRGLPGVRNACVAWRAPLESHGGGMSDRVVIPGYPLPPGVPNLEIRMTAVGPGYFSLLGIRLLAGRAFDSHDTASSQPVVIINETMARRFFAGGNAVDRLIRLGAAGKAHDVRIVGVVNDVRIEEINEKPEPYFFLPYTQLGQGDITLMVETAGPPMQKLNMIRKAMHEVDSNVTDIEVTTLEDLVQSAVGMQRVLAIVVTILALLGLTLAAIGLYGVVSYSVARRTREMGVRMALGAQFQNVMGLILREGLVLAGVGCAAGLALSLAATRLLQGTLYGVSPQDPVTFATVIAVMTAVCLFASYVPARRASKADPMVALREE